MQKQLSRKKFLSLAALSGALTLALKPLDLLTQTPVVKKPKGDPLASELVKEWVTVAHGKYDRVKELFAQEPRLLNAAWDWGSGDFETALEAAGHVGNREIAEFLLANGARMNIFCAAMLGRLDIVKPTLEAFPNLKTSAGPHGLQLKHHAAKGGEQALAVMEYLEAIGAA